MNMIFQNLYDVNDYTVVIGNNGYNDELIEYISKNKVDLLVSINLSQHDFKKSLKKTNFFSYMETPMPNTLEFVGQPLFYKKKNINFKLDYNKVDISFFLSFQKSITLYFLSNVQKIDQFILVAVICVTLNYQNEILN